MIEEKLYRETFAKLHASPRAKKEVIETMKMKERTTRKPLRVAVIAAAMIAALAVSAGAVSLTGDGTLLKLLNLWSDGYQTLYEVQDAEGNVMAIDITATAAAEITQEEGRMLLTAAGETVDITDDLARNGAYHFEAAAGERTSVVDVTGSPEAWTMTETVSGPDGSSYTLTSTSTDTNASVQEGTIIASDGTDSEENATVTTTTLTDE